MNNILIYTHDKEMFDLLADTLKHESFSCVLANKSDQLLKKLEKFKTVPPVIILIDLDVYDDLSGWQACKLIKKEKISNHIPVIMISGDYKTSTDIVLGFQHGIDDYIIKPFNPSVLLARIKAILRRIPPHYPSRTESNLITSFDKTIVIDVKKRLVYLRRRREKKPGSVKEDFTPKEFELLCLLLKNPERALSRVYIAESVWGKDYYDASRTIDKHVETLRKKLGVFGKKIVSVSGVGYKFQGKP